MRFLLLFLFSISAFGNTYYTPSGVPAQGSSVSSASLRNEFISIQSGFNKLPDLTALPANQFILVNSAGSSLISVIPSTALGLLSTNLANLSTVTPGALGESILATTTAFTFNLPMNSHKITGLAAGTSTGDSARYDELVTKANSGANTDITSLNSPELLAATATTQTGSDSTTKVATTAQVQAAIAIKDTLTVHLAGAETITGKKTFSAGAEPSAKNTAKAWATFDGTGGIGAIAPLSAFNIASITKNGTGDYTLTFTTAMADANYIVSGTGSIGSPAGGVRVLAVSDSTPPSTTSVRVYTSFTASAQDCARISVAIFGN